MTDPRALERLLGAYFAEGSEELADRVLDAALDEIDHTHQRRALRTPRRFQAMPMFTRVAAAAVIGVLAVGGTFVLLQRQQPAGSDAGSTPIAPASPSLPAPTPSSAPSSPRVGATGPLGVGRQIHTATPLADGRVLVAGGYDVNDAAIDDAVVYDPGSGTFGSTGRLTTSRGLHAATLLPDGRVLITGGGPAGWVTAGAYLTSAELYDPASGTFANAAAMATPREDHTATLLGDGRVLIAGGNDLNGHAIASAELYDPTTGTFSPTGSMTTARGFHTATLLADGRVLIVGGDPGAWTSGGPMIASAEIYDPATGIFTETGSLATGRTWHTATLLADGRVLVTGGDTGSQQLSSAELYDPSTGTFAQTGSMAYGREYHTATLLADGRVLVTGGGGDYTNLKFLSSAELYDPSAGTFTTTGPMAEARTFHQATRLQDGRVLITGGYGTEAPLASAELYDPATSTFTSAGAGG